MSEKVKAIYKTNRLLLAFAKSKSFGEGRDAADEGRKNSPADCF